MIYPLDELLDDRNRALYELLSAQAPIVLGEANDDCWGEQMRGGVIHIFCAPTKRPVASFTHELLHGKYDLAGMEQPRFLPRAIDEAALQELEKDASELMSYAYNQMIHHKMFPDFVALGFPAAEFLHESDEQDGLQRVAKDIAKLKTWRKKDFPDGAPARLIVWPFLFLNSPHDHRPASQNLLKELRKLSGGSFYALRTLLTNFVADSTPNVARYIARLFYLCDLPDVAFGREKGDLIWAADCVAD